MSAPMRVGAHLIAVGLAVVGFTAAVVGALGLKAGCAIADWLAAQELPDI